MKAVRTFLLAIIALVVATSGSVMAQTFTPVDVSKVKIKNFGQMDDRFFRGAQPKEDQYKQLADLGIKTIIDLRDDAQDYAKSAVEALGMRYVNIPMSDKDYPPSVQIEEFVKLVADPSTGKFYVHCAGGRHRTGVAGAVYRFNNYHWSYDQVYKEMKFYDFYTRWGHGDMKKFVEDYAATLQKNANHATQTQTDAAKQ